MTPTRRQGKNIDTRQRSFHLTDDVYAIVQESAAEAGISNSAWISNLIREAPTVRRERPVDPAAMTAVGEKIAQVKATGKRNIILPDERASTFTVQGGEVKTKRLASDDQTGGVERTPEELKRLRGRRGRHTTDIEI